MNMFLNKSFGTSLLQCELCKKVTSKQNINICESGHSICNNCDDLTDTEKSEEYNDDSSEGDDNADENNNYSAKHFGSGDHFKIERKTPELSNVEKKSGAIYSKGACKANSMENAVDSQHFVYESPVETTLLYKNLSYDDYESGLRSCAGTTCNADNGIEKVSVRPIVCPVLHCGKTVALDSVLKHFNFDHSKIPTLPINVRKTLKIYLKPANLSTNIQCVAIINPIGVDSPFVLMAAKLINENRQKITDSNVSQNKSDSQIHFQIKNRDEHCHNVNKGSHEEIIVWICRFTEAKYIYTVTVKRDRILSYNYVGKGLHIQNEINSPSNLYKSAECLIIRQCSVEKLLDEKNHIHVYINISK